MTTSINFHMRPSAKEGRHTGKLFIRVIRNRQSKHISRDYSVYPDEWNSDRKNVILPSGSDDNERKHKLIFIAESMKSDLKRLQEIVSQLEEGGDYSVSDIVGRFTSSLKSSAVLGYAEITGARLRESGRERTARAYRTAARRLMSFKGGKDVLLSDIDVAMIAEYEQYLLGKGLVLNTVSFYLRNLRALYFRAVAEKIIPQQPVNPFAGMHTGVYETKRRALDGEQIKALAALEKPLLEQLDALSIDLVDHSAECRKISVLHDSLLYFLFCYHARGMSFVDLANLRWSDIGQTNLTYRRRKTGGLLELKITEPMKKVISFFGQRTQDSVFVFPLIDPSRSNAWQQYETALKRQNRSLKVLAGMAGISEPLSTHAARHTWATLAKRLHIPVAVIGEALGHRDVKTTSIYLASFDRTTMDELSIKLSEAVKAA